MSRDDTPLEILDARMRRGMLKKLGQEAERYRGKRGNWAPKLVRKTWKCFGCGSILVQVVASPENTKATRVVIAATWLGSPYYSPSTDMLHDQRCLGRFRRGLQKTYPE